LALRFALSSILAFTILALFNAPASAEQAPSLESTALGSLSAPSEEPDSGAPAALAPSIDGFASSVEPIEPASGRDPEALDVLQIETGATDPSAALADRRLDALLSSPPAARLRDLTVARSLARPQTTDEAIAEAVARGTNPDLLKKKRGGFRKHNNDLFRAERPVEFMDREMIVRLRLRAKRSEPVSVELKF
jgi:hypothetical protein